MTPAALIAGLAAAAGAVGAAEAIALWRGRRRSRGRALGAGLTPRRALAEVGRRHPGTLAAELRRAAARAALGEPVERALDRLEARCAAEGVRPLADALRRAERHGAPLARSLAAQAAEA